MITLTAEQLERIQKHAESTYPDECCGAILGTFSPNTNGAVEEAADRTAADILPIDNRRNDGEAYHRFLITPKDFIFCEKEARKQKLDLIGFYHSHPDHPSKPSQYDLERAFPVYSYVIVSVQNGKYDIITSWIMQNDRSQFIEEKIIQQ
ncbi:MAG: M67 family metallopeptidase [Planctomycetaceae bacterium]|jgi:proteasome lid subunit RPN8/RPN11|nr:M67 family metallopeptidase [Planctomycetaceae bacterium]